VAATVWNLCHGQSSKSWFSRIFFPRNEIQKLEQEFQGLEMMGSAHQEYTTRFQEVAQIVPHLCTPVSRWIKRYIWELAPQVRGTTMGRNPQTAQDAIEFSAALTDEAIRSGAFGKVVPTEKRKWNNNKNQSGSSRNSNTFKKPANAIRTFAATQPQAPIQQQAGKIGYAGPNPRCDKCQLHHVGLCVPCLKCNRMGREILLVWTEGLL
jgi:hypothetical protein